MVINLSDYDHQQFLFPHPNPSMHHDTLHTPPFFPHNPQSNSTHTPHPIPLTPAPHTSSNYLSHCTPCTFPTFTQLWSHFTLIVATTPCSSLLEHFLSLITSWQNWNCSTQSTVIHAKTKIMQAIFHFLSKLKDSFFLNSCLMYYSLCMLLPFLSQCLSCIQEYASNVFSFKMKN